MTSRDVLARRWPEQLVDQLCRNNCILVVGAGLSMNSTNEEGKSPPSWSDLIKSLTRAYATGATKAEINKMVSHGSFLDAAQYLRMLARTASKESDFLSAIAVATDGNAQSGGNFMSSKVHETLLRLNPDVIVTTNYDKILERASANGFNVHAHTSTKLGRAVRSGQAVIVKIHGSVDDPDNIILTRTDYTRLRKEGADALKVLQALFLTRTALFVGYSLSDPDVQLLLENVVGARSEPTSHYMLAPKNIKTYQRDVLRYSYGTDLVNFKPGDFGEMHEMLSILADLVDARLAAGSAV